MPVRRKLGPPARVVGALFLLCTLVLSGGRSQAVEPAGGAGSPPKPGYRVVVDLPSRTLSLHLGDRLIRRYPVAIGSPTTPSPLGHYRIVVEVPNPTWYPSGRPPVPPGPANPVGTRWLGLNAPGLGIHGTNNPSSIGHAVSGGCIRMYNRDVEELSAAIDPGTLVEFTYETIDVVPLAPGDLSSQQEEEAALLHAYALAIHPDVYGRGVNTVDRVRQRLRAAGISAAVDEARLAQQVKEADGTLQPLPVVPRVVVAGRPARSIRVADGRLWLPLGEAAELVGEPIFAWGGERLEVKGETLVPALAVAQRYGYRVKAVPAAAALYLNAPLVYWEGRPVARAFVGPNSLLVPVEALAKAANREVAVAGCLAVSESNRTAPVRWRGEEAYLIPEDAARLFALEMSIDGEGVWFRGSSPEVAGP